MTGTNLRHTFISAKRWKVIVVSNTIKNTSSVMFHQHNSEYTLMPLTVVLHFVQKIKLWYISQFATNEGSSHIVKWREPSSGSSSEDNSGKGDGTKKKEEEILQP